jgi:hypothetical protein
MLTYSYKTTQLSIIFALVYSQAYAGAWTQPKHSLFLSAGLGYYAADKFYDINGNSTDIPTYTKYDLNPYVEYGFSDNLTLGGSARLEYIDQSSQQNLGLGDSHLFARQRVYRSDFLTLSLQPGVLIPRLYQSDDAPQVGSDSAAYELKALAGINFDAFDCTHYAGVDGGYRLRGGDEDDQFLLDLSLGSNISEGWTILAQNFNVISSDLPNLAASSITAENDYTLSKIQLSVVNELTPATSLQVGGYMDVYSRNTGKGQGALISIWRTF